MEQVPIDLKIKPQKALPLEDRWILSRLTHTVCEVNTLLEEFQLGEAERVVHDFLWGEYCDWYIELAKIRIHDPKAPSPLPFEPKLPIFSPRGSHFVILFAPYSET